MISLFRTSLTAVVILLLFVGCGGGGGGSVGGGVSSCSGGGGGGNITVSWVASKAAAVNKIGGGYIVYSSKTSGFNPGDGGVSSKRVPYISGAVTPSSTTFLTTSSGRWYVRVSSFSPLNAPDMTGGSESLATSQISVCQA